jgi:fibronectin type 3 domain-containing protein
MSFKKEATKIMALILIEIIILYPLNFAHALKISNIEVTDNTGASAKVNWETDKVADSTVKFGKTKDLGFFSRSSAFVFEHSQQLLNLEPETEYFYEIESKDISGDKAVYNNDGQPYSFTTRDTTPPFVVKGVKVSATTGNSITISWQPSDAPDLSHYIISRNFVFIGNTTDTQFQDQGLEPRTSYRYHVSAVDKTGNAGARSSTLTASTGLPGSSTASSTEITDINIVDIKDSSARIIWLTSSSSNSIVYFGANNILDNREELPALTTNHSIVLSNLIKGVSYDFVLSSCDQANICVNSSRLSFEAGFDIIPPLINATLPKFVNKGVIDISGTTEPFSSVKLFINDLNFPKRALDSSETSTGKFEFANVQLQKENVIKILVTDKGGNLNDATLRVSVDTEKPTVVLDELPKVTSKKNISIVGLVDEFVTINFFLRSGKDEIPERIANLKAATGENSVVLDWDEIKDSEFSHYIIYREDVGPIAITNPSSYNTFTDLLVNKDVQYRYQVSAVNNFGREGVKSDPVAVKLIDGRSDVAKPNPIDKLLISDPTLTINTSASFSESLKLTKDGDYSLAIEVLDRAKNRVLVEKSFKLDTKAPDIKILSPPSGTLIFENYANQLDIQGITEPNAKVHLFVERTPLGFLENSFDISGLPNRIEDIDESKLDAKCRLEFGGRNSCPTGADFTTTADSSGGFKFNNVDLTSIVSGGFRFEQIPGRELSDEQRFEETKRSKLVFIATDESGLRKAIKHELRVGTCWAGNQTWELIPLTEFQSPGLLSPQRLAENKETIYFYYNYSYIGRGDKGKIRPNGISIRSACSGTEFLGDRRFNLSCQILPGGALATAVNPDGTVSYSAIRLNRLENMDRFLQDDWKDFLKSLNNELTFPFKFIISYEHEVDGTTVRETQQTCTEVTYVLDNSLIDPREVLPDWLLYDFVDFLNESITTINDISVQVGKVLDFVVVGCVTSFVLRLGFQIYRRFVSFGEEKTFILKTLGSKLLDNKLVKFNVKTDEDTQYCNDLALKVMEANSLTKKYDNPLFGLKLKYFSDSDLKRCFPNAAAAWETEATMYQFYRTTCDRVFGHSTPSGWTENLDDEKIFAKLQEGEVCGIDQSVRGKPLSPVPCEKIVDEFGLDANKYLNKQCFGVPTSGGKDLWILSNQVPGSEDLYEITKLSQLGAEVETSYAIKQTETAFLTKQAESCSELCTGIKNVKATDFATINGQRVSLVPDKKTKNVQEDEKNTGYLCATSSDCKAWGLEGRAEVGGQILKSDGKPIEIKFTTPKGYTSSRGNINLNNYEPGCFPPDTEFSQASDNPDQRVECCCLNTGGVTQQIFYVYDDLNRYDSPRSETHSGGRQPAFESKKDPEGAPENFKDLKWSYRYWKEGYVTVCNSDNKVYGELCPPGEDVKKVTHSKYNPNRYIEGRDWPACFGFNNPFFRDVGIPEGENGNLLTIDSKQQFTSAFICGNIGGIQNRLKMINNFQTALASCLIDIRTSGTSDAAACKELFTRYLCSSIWQVISLATDSCSPFSVKTAISDEDDYFGFVRDGIASISQSISDTQIELQEEYGNAKLNNLVGAGAGEVARKVCLAAFGYDWDLNVQNVIDAAYSQSFATFVQATTGTREYLTIEPTSGQARYDYRASWMINPGCDIESYRVDLACVSRDELDRYPGIQCNKIGSPDGNNCDCLNRQDKEITERFFSSRGRIPQNQLVQDSKDEVVSSRYRYDHLKFTIRADRKLKGDLKNSCFPPGHEDGVFYFHLRDKTPRDIAACELDVTSGIFQCSPGLDFWSKKGLANIESIEINGEKPKSNKITIFRGDDLKITPTVFKSKESPKKCLVADLKKQGTLTGSRFIDIDIDNSYRYPNLIIEENVQPITNPKILPRPQLTRCTENPKKQSGKTCKEIISRLSPSLDVVSRNNGQEIFLDLEFIDEDDDGSINIGENSQDRFILTGTGIAPDGKVLGIGGWYSENHKGPVIDLPNQNIKLKINRVPFEPGVKSARYTLTVPAITSSESDNVWNLEIGLYEADELTGQCSRANRGEPIVYQGSDQFQKYSVIVRAKAEEVNKPDISFSFDNNNNRIFHGSNENIRLNIDITDDVGIGTISYELTKPEGPGRNWGEANPICNPQEKGKGVRRKVCTIDINEANLDIVDAGTYKISVTVLDFDDTPQKSTKDAFVEVACGPTSNGLYGLCRNVDTCPGDIIDYPIRCQSGFKCCKGFG